MKAQPANSEDKGRADLSITKKDDSLGTRGALESDRSPGAVPLSFPLPLERRVRRDIPEIDRSERLDFVRPTIFAGFGAISFGFVCQHSSFLVYRSMSKRGVERWTYVTKWSVCIALVMGMTLALGGYWNFVDQTEGNILNNFSTEHKPASVARGFLAVTMVSRALQVVGLGGQTTV